MFLIVNIMGFTSYATNSDDTIVVGVSAHRCPMFYIDDDGKITGIGVELMNEAAKEASLNVVYKDITENNLKQALDNPEYDVIMPFGSAIKSESGKDIIISDNIINMPFTFLSLKTSNFTDLENITVGMANSQKGVSETLKELYPDIHIIYYDTTEEGIEELRNKKVDALVNNAYIWSYVIQKPSYSDLNVSSTILFSVDFRVGCIDTKENRVLIDRLNKGISKVEDTKKQAIVLDYTSRKLYKYDLGDYVYTYGLFFLLTLLIIFSLIIWVNYKQKSLKLQNEEYITQLINNDTLTGALTMHGFREKAEQLLKHHGTDRYMILYINFRDFKYINSTFGKKASDDLLKFMVTKSKSVLNENELIGRIESDHFVILRKIGENDILADDEVHVLAPVRNYFIDKNKEFTVRVCCGVYILTEENHNNPDIDYMIDLARVAEKKVRDAKKFGYELYNPGQWQRGKWLSDIVNHLQFAIDNDEIQVYYQPQVNFSTGKITGAEALCRWNHTKLGWISPGDFIPALEDAGLIDKLDYHIWEKVCKDLSRWNEQGIHKTVSINVSRYDIKEGVDIVEYLHSLIQKYNLDVNQLNLEITETAYVENASLIDITKRLRDIGFHVEIDDFGSGYSSLNMLKEIPVDRIKMDLRFLSGSGTEEKGRIIIECMIFMAKRLGIDLIAEGVETLDQANMLKEFGCLDMQGWYFYKALPVDEFEKV